MLMDSPFSCSPVKRKEGQSKETMSVSIPPGTPEKVTGVQWSYGTQ